MPNPTAEIPKLIRIAVRGPGTEARHLMFRTVPGFIGLTSPGDGKTYAVFERKPRPQDEARLHQMAGGPP